MDLKVTDWREGGGVELVGSGFGPVAGSCIYGDKPTGYLVHCTAKQSNVAGLLYLDIKQNCRLDNISLQ
jgi:hypothetical protein